MQTTSALVSLVLGLSATLATAAHADAPDYVRVRNVSYAGTGCPAGSLATNVSPDATSLALLFDSMIAEVGPGVSLTESRKNCQINLDLDVPSGWSYSVDSVDVRGYVSLERGVTATQQTSYYFQGQAQTARLHTDFRGPVDRAYVIRDSLGTDGQVWSPCGAQRSLNVNFEVRASAAADDARGLITLEDLDGQDAVRGFRLKWRRCDG